MQTLNDIYIYPIKSTQAISIPAGLIEEKGLSLDRRYMLADESGKFITGRTHPQLTQIKVEFSGESLLVQAPNMRQLTITPDEFAEEKKNVQVWSDKFQALHCGLKYDSWFSDYLNEPCQLLFFSADTKRLVKNRETQVSFADGYPLLLINQKSLDQLNSRLHKPVSALNFRPNIIVAADFPFVEDSWARIKIGEVEFEVSKPCSRCLFINVDPKTGIADKKEPLATLATFRYTKGDINFGQNLIPLNSGFIRTGDELKVLATKTTPFYGSQTEANNNHKKMLKIDYQGSAISTIGDNQQLLLDQAEQAGIHIPYSCRGGQCGCCKVKLLEGEVNVLKSDALSDSEKEQGYLLACSCIPLSDIVIDC